MHPRWYHDRGTFLAYILNHLGDRPEGFSIDRIDNNKGYVPGNLRWANAKTQLSNRRPSTTFAGKPIRKVVYQGELMTQSECAKRIGKSREYLRQIRIGRTRDRYGIRFTS